MCLLKIASLQMESAMEKSISDQPAMDGFKLQRYHKLINPSSLPGRV